MILHCAEARGSSGRMVDLPAASLGSVAVPRQLSTHHCQSAGVISIAMDLRSVVGRLCWYSCSSWGLGATFGRSGRSWVLDGVGVHVDRLAVGAGS